MSLPELAKRLESVTSTLSIVGRTILGLDTNPVPADWTHITKVDPEREKELPLAFALYLSHTSAVSVGGSQDVTAENSEETFELLAHADVPTFHEPSDSTHVTDTTHEHSNFIAVPEVLNGDSESLVGTLGKGIEYVQEEFGPRMVEEKLGVDLEAVLGDRVGNFAAAYLMAESVFEAYIIMNPDSAAAREANVGEDDLLSPQEAKERALAAEYHLNSEVIYLEYSGTFGGQEAVDILEAIDEGVSWSRVWYGGGLDSRENANAVLDAGADAVIVGDVFHDIATLESDLAERAISELETGASSEEIQSWVESEVTENNPAFRYLSTIPDVPDPEARAIRYLAVGVEIALALAEIAGGRDEATSGEISEELDAEPLPGESQFVDVLSDDDAAELSQLIAMNLLARRFDLPEEDPSVTGQLGVELPE